MLQIIIGHELNPVKTFIYEVREYEDLDSYAVFDKSIGKIDLSCLKGHEGESVMITHFIIDNSCTRLDYETVRHLTKVDTDENGFDYIEYN